MTRVRTITVRCKTPLGVSDEDIAEFIINALESDGGSRHPDDPLFGSLSVHNVEIRNIIYVNPSQKDAQ
jgi:hypothetical protein